MNYWLPDYIIDANINSPLINYTWYDPNPAREFVFGSDHALLEKLSSVGLRAKIALCIACHEWVLGRFVGLTQKTNPYQLAEAAWCANVDVRYLAYFEYEPDQYTGPVERALLYSAVNLLRALYVSDNVYDQDDIDEKDPEYLYDFDEWRNTLTNIIALVRHILPNPSLFNQWLQESIDRLVVYYLQGEEDSFANLFGQDNNETMLGDYVPREVFDITPEFDKSQTIALINHYLAAVDKSNPLLSPLEELQKIIPNPYQI